jgi:hypothetical protein
MISPGDPVRLEIRGYRHAYQQVRVDKISDGVVTHAKVGRLLGLDEIEHLLPDSGPVVLVTSYLPASTFMSGGEKHRLYHGMLGNAEILLRRETLLMRLTPSVRAIFDE